jgi:exodeoxyribonuclease VII large subunit
MSEEFLTVSELNNFIKDVLCAGFPQAVWVCGEIQQYDRGKNKKHIFFELVEKDAVSRDVKARIGLVIFANRREAIEGILKKSENAFDLKDDIEVKFLCRVDFYPPHGAVRLIVEGIDPTYTLGKIAQEKQKLIALLKEKGALDKNKQLALPEVPLSLGLITADDSAAYNDFISELRKSAYAFKVYLRHTVMQGRNSARDVCSALNELRGVKGLDAVVITRGGGSIAELSCFDSALIAEHIAAYPVPVLSGIGHEINITVTDLAAHAYAKTPTAIAQYFVGRVEDFLTDLEEKVLRAVHGARAMVDQEKGALKDLAVSLRQGTTLFLKDHQDRMIRLEEFLKTAPLRRIKDAREDLMGKGGDLKAAARARVEAEHRRLKSYQRIIEIAHPKNTMRRGFSVTRTADGRILRGVSQAGVGREITTEVVDGNVRSKVLGEA